MVPSSYESSFSDGPHPHAYASPPRGYRSGQSHSAGQGQGQRGRSASTGERDVSGRSTSRTPAPAPAQTSGSALSRADSIPARSSSRHARDSPADDARHHGQSPSHAAPRRGSAGSAGRPYPSPTYSTDSYTSYHSSSSQISPNGRAGLNPSPSPAALRHPMTRLLSPDLPPRDALYLFCNFASYMRSPQEGAEGIRDNTDFGDTIRLLDFARVGFVTLHFTCGYEPSPGMRPQPCQYMSMMRTQSKLGDLTCRTKRPIRGGTSTFST